MTLPRTPSQTVGPYYAIGAVPPAENELAAPATAALAARSAGCSTATATPITDGMIELWDAAGRDAGGGAAPTPTGAFSFVVAEAGAGPARRRTSTSSSSRAACCGTS